MGTLCGLTRVDCLIVESLWCLFMPNKNYIAGRAFEYERAKAWREAGFYVMRTAGSHGFADLITINPENGEIRLIQCKRVGTLAEGNRLIEGFKKDPPFTPYKAKFQQSIEVKLKGKSEVMSWTV